MTELTTNSDLVDLPFENEAIFLECILAAIETIHELKSGQVLARQASMMLDHGLSITVHPNDHDTHFHIQHRGMGIDARFNYPDMEFMDYKYCKKGGFSQKQIRNISATCVAFEGWIGRKLEEAGR